MSQRLEFLLNSESSLWYGMMAGAVYSKISNQPVTFESNRPIRIFAGPYVFCAILQDFIGIT